MKKTRDNAGLVLGSFVLTMLLAFISGRAEPLTIAFVAWFIGYGTGVLAGREE